MASPRRGIGFVQILPPPIRPVGGFLPLDFSMPGPSLRLFVALELPDPVRESLAAIATLAPQLGRGWTPPRNLHLTLKFLGQVPAEGLEPVSAALRGIPFKPFVTHPTGFCCFPTPRRARILAVELADADDHLKTLAAAIDTACEPLGFPRETRPFRPHITLARGKPTLPADVVGRVLGRADQLFPGPPWTVDRFVLMRSTLGNGPPVYRVVEEFLRLMAPDTSASVRPIPPSRPSPPSSCSPSP